MHLEIVTPDRKVFEGEAVSVQLPGTDGLFEIPNNHAPLIGALGNGSVRIRTASGSEQRLTIDGGVVEVLNNKIVVLAESAQQ